MLSTANEVIGGYLDVKISSRSRRGLKPWKAWQKQWCEIRRLDSIENGVEFKLKSSPDGAVLSCVFLPRSATICRTESRTKQYAFGVFNLGRNKKPILFLAGISEYDSQEWMFSIRRMLAVASYIPVGESNFRISLVDNNHSRAAGLIGLFGVLNASPQEIVISDPCTGITRITWKWYHFHQFHLQVPIQAVDDKFIVVMHTSGEFPAGPGQLYLYCKQGSKLLHHLISRGNCPNVSPGLMSMKRLSHSEGDLISNITNCAPDSPMCFRSQTGSDDSGVRVSIGSDDSEYNTKSKTESSLVKISLVTKTPGDSETEDSCQDLVNGSKQQKNGLLPRNESGFSLASGIYEEIPENHETKSSKKMDFRHSSHIYENPLDLIFDRKTSKYFHPPPLPPRRSESDREEEERIKAGTPTRLNFFVPFKHRCSTLPAKDLSKISQTFISESEYVIMSPSKTLEKPKKTIVESFYMPMSPVIHLKNKIVESCYMSMNGGCKKT